MTAFYPPLFPKVLFDESFKAIARLTDEDEVRRLYEVATIETDSVAFETSGINAFRIGVRIITPDTPLVRTHLPFIDLQATSSVEQAKTRVRQVLTEFQPKIQVRPPSSSVADDGRDFDIVPIQLIKYLYEETLNIME